MHVVAVRVTLEDDRGLGLVTVPLMRYPQLVVADDLGVRYLFPLGGAAEVLGAQGLVAQYLRVGRHGDEISCRHGLPQLVQEGSIVDPKGWGDAFLEAFPVLMDNLS